MHAAREQIEGGLLGLLVGDALGVPYEFHDPSEIPPLAQIDMVPPLGFLRSYSHIEPGTWSDDGSQALCLLESLLESQGWNPDDFASRLLAWFRNGHLAVGGKVFDVGIQTGVALERLASGISPLEAGLDGERNNGNGSLMRTLPAVLLHNGDDDSLVALVHAQSCLTHAHPRSQVCCALYALWARKEMQNSHDPWDDAVRVLLTIYSPGSPHRTELERTVLLFPENHPVCGSGYVVDCLHSARAACQEPDYPSIIRAAVAFGNDTDTTACVAGGIAGLRHGRRGIPADWLSALRGGDILLPILTRLNEGYQIVGKMGVPAVDPTSA